MALAAAAAAASEPPGGPTIVLPEGATVDDVFNEDKKADLFQDNTLQRSPRQIGKLSPRELVSGELSHIFPTPFLCNFLKIQAS